MPGLTPQIIETLTRSIQALTEQQRAGLRNISARETGSTSQSSFHSWLANQTGTQDVAKGFRNVIQRHQNAISNTEIPTADPAQQQATPKLGWRGGANALLSGLGVNYQFKEKPATSSTIKSQHDKKVKIAGAKMESTSKDPAGISAKEAELAARAAEGDPTAAAELAEKEVEKKKKLIEKMGNEGKAMFNSRHGMEAGAHGLRGVAAGIDTVDSSGTLSAPLKFGAAILESVEKVRKFTDEMHQANMQFAEFSGSMAAVQAQSEARDFERNRLSGDARSGSAGRLAEARGNLEDAARPIDDAWSNIKNDLTATFVNILSPIVEGVGKIVDKLGLGGSGDAGNHDINQIAGRHFTPSLSDPQTKKDWTENYGKPKGY